MLVKHEMFHVKHLLGNSRARRREVEPALERALCHRRVGEDIAGVARLRLDECHHLPLRLNVTARPLEQHVESETASCRSSCATMPQVKSLRDSGKCVRNHPRRERMFHVKRRRGGSAPPC